MKNPQDERPAEPQFELVSETKTQANTGKPSRSLSRLAQSVSTRLTHGLGITAIGVFLGVLVSVSALAVFALVDGMLDIWRPSQTIGFVGYTGFHPILFVVPLAAAFLVGGILTFLKPETPVELADVIAAAHQPEPAVPQVSGYTSLVKSVLSVGAGASAGLYGPLLVLAASLAASVRKLLNLSSQYAEMALGAGVAAAISATFAAPLAGIVFAHEVVLRHYSLRFFAPVTIAAATAYVVSKQFSPGNMSLLPELTSRGAGPVDIAMLILLGVCAGLLAVAMMRLLETMRVKTVTSPVPVWLRPVLAALGLGTLAHVSPAILGPGLDVIAVMLEGGLSAVDLATLTVLKIIASCLCLALFFHGGVIGPSLFVGAGLGGFFAAVVGALSPITGYQPDASLFALAGMAAMASCVIGGPLAMILISLELGHDYSATTALVVTIVTANLLSSRLYARSTLEPQLLAKGIDLSLGRENLALQSIPVTDIMTKDHLTLPTTASVRQAIDAMAKEQCGEAHLIDENGLWAGKLCLYHLVDQDPNASSLLLMEDAPLVLSVNDHALYAQQTMQAFIGEGVPVLDEGKLVGIVHEASLFRHARMVTRSVWQHDHETAAIDLPQKIRH